MPKLLIALPLLALALLAALAAAMAFGGPAAPPPMPSINDPFKGLDHSDLPATRRFTARDGTPLAYRAYLPASTARGSVVLVHGSSARGSSMHVLARAFAAAGFAAYALDVRGHGDSGVKGRIAYIGQLDDDLEDFVRAMQPARPATLAGFSSGGGFALRIAAGTRQTMFDGYLLLAPFLSQDAPTYRRDGGGWVEVGLPRYVAIGFLHALGVRAFDDLPVTRFALNDVARAMLTPQYSFALAENFRPRADWRASIRAARQPMRLLAGADDEAFHAERFGAVFQSEGRDVPVTLLPGLGHIALTLDPAAARAAVAAVQHMDAAHAPLGDARKDEAQPPGAVAMNATVDLLHRQPLIFFHLATALGALLLGLVLLVRRKGTRSHRRLGWTWVALMGSTALASAFIRDDRLPNLLGLTPIHLLTVTVAVMLPLALVHVRRGNVRGHRRTMIGLYLGACVVAGLFTLLPGRFLGSLLWGTPLTGIAS